MNDAYDRDDPKHPGYLDRMTDAADDLEYGLPVPGKARLLSLVTHHLTPNESGGQLIPAAAAILDDLLGEMAERLAREFANIEGFAQQGTQYPHEDCGLLVLGPGIIAERDRSVLNWDGQNYTPQPERDPDIPASRSQNARDGAPTGFSWSGAKLPSLLAQRDKATEAPPADPEPWRGLTSGKRRSDTLAAKEPEAHVWSPRDAKTLDVFEIAARLARPTEVPEPEPDDLDPRSTATCRNCGTRIKRGIRGGWMHTNGRSLACREGAEPGEPDPFEDAVDPKRLPIRCWVCREAIVPITGGWVHVFPAVSEAHADLHEPGPVEPVDEPESPERPNVPIQPKQPATPAQRSTIAVCRHCGEGIEWVRTVTDSAWVHVSTHWRQCDIHGRKSRCVVATPTE